MRTLQVTVGVTVDDKGEGVGEDVGHLILVTVITVLTGPAPQQVLLA